ncbi:hypothetical protein I350_08017 [Cryptococcus amylolentus CBS 6273]|uniref:Actin interacting protein 3 C-terminal domain-containing protein n=1 Tax=Cryptococcus amylolentus CBS 6273 TaxID=1296118 RepID=A0A1E3J849_9TREE|nr:hypothetical protein I350_08017 [Cryptococcus amylolentus CBS 6273]
MSRNISYPVPQAAPHIGQPRASSSAGDGYYTSSSSKDRHARQTSGSRSAYPNALDSSITRLLVTTKQLLQGLEQWSQGIISETDVSDIYVRLGNGFETCVQAFNRVSIETSELSSIPQDLRNCLEQCLSEEQSREALELYLPEIRQIIYNLLQGLKQKQSQYKRMMQDKRSYEPSSSLTNLSQTSQAPAAPAITQPTAQPAPNPPRRNASREYPDDPRLSGRSGTSTASASPSMIPQQLPQGYPSVSPIPTQRTPSNPALAERERRPMPSRPPPPDAFRPARPPGPRRPSSPNPPHQDGIHHVMARGGSSDSQSQSSYDIPVISISPGSRSSSGTALAGAPSAPSLPQSVAPQPKPNLSINTNKPTPPRPDRFPRDSFGRPVSRFSMDSEASVTSPVNEAGASVAAGKMDAVPEEEEKRGSVDLKRRPARTSFDRQSRASGSSERHSQQPSSENPALPSLELPGQINLQSSTPPAAQENYSSLHPNLPSPESLPIPEVPPGTRATLAALGRSDVLERRASKRFSSFTMANFDPSSPRASPQRPTRRAAQQTAREREQQQMQQTSAITPLPEGVGLGVGVPDRAGGSRGGSPNLEQVQEDGDEDATHGTIEPSSPTGSVRIVKTPPPSSPSATPRPPSDPTLPPRDPNKLPVFLQIGRKTKKQTLDLPITLEQLKLVFMERFEYDPGKEDFPDVYIRDKDGMEYELEGIEDLREGCTLCLNIEPLDQVKLHIDSTFATLMTEMKDLRSALAKEKETTKRLSVLAPPALKEDLALSPSASPNQVPASAASLPAPTPLVVGPTEDHIRQLQEQHDELGLLRRELAISRQAHNEHLEESTTTITALRDELAAMKKITAVNPNSNRALVDKSKAELDTQFTDTIKAVEDITDVIDAARIDAYKRYVTPSKRQLDDIRAELAKSTQMVDDFAKAVKLADPAWRGTWQSELHRVMEEQKLLNHQIKLVGDLKKDVEDAKSMWGFVENFVEQRATGNRPVKVRVGADAGDETSGGGDISTLLLEIRNKEADPDSRLRAIEAQQRMREKERLNKVDDFEAELRGFVGGRKLKKTGGAEEADRLRLRKDEVMLRAQLTGGSGTGTGTATPGTGGKMVPQTTGQSVQSGRGPLSPQGTGTSVPVVDPASVSLPNTPAKSDVGSAGGTPIKNESGQSEPPVDSEVPV